MKCGICSKTTMRGYNTSVRVPISSVYYLNQHKAADHPAEYQAAREAHRTKAEIAKAETQRISDARLAASRPVVARHPWSDENEPVTYPSSKVSRFDVTDWAGEPRSIVRFPDAQA